MEFKILRRLRNTLLLLGLCASGSIVQGQVYTFTNAGATGINGPTQLQVTNAYLSTTLAGSVTVTGGIQSWTVPTSGPYKIEVYGANGYGVYGGKGAYMSGEFNLNANDVLKILVGQMGSCCHSTGTNQYGGGGGSFVVAATGNTPLIIAGGGGGGATFYNSINLASSHNTVADASITTTAKTAAGTTNGAGGTAGNGGAAGNTGGGGGGFLTDGLPSPQGGLSFLNGGAGGSGTSGQGGFGGGGGISGQNNMRAGGGGGYSGGGGCGSSTTVVQIGGGGGSFNSGTNQVNTPGLGTGHGQVVITKLGPPCNAPTGLTATGVTSNSANTSWSAVTGATGYEYVVNTSATPPATGTPTTGTTYGAGGLTSATTYYLHVRTQCNPTTFSGWTSIPFTTLATPPCASPGGLAATGLTTTDVTLNWNAVPSSMGYEYAITTSATPPASGNGTNATTYTTNTLTQGTTYYAHVRNQCAAALFSAWATISFTTPYPPCNAPNVTLSNITTGGVTINWTAVSGAVGYQYAVDSSSVPPTAGTNTTATTETIAGLIDNTPYFVHVRANCGAGGFSPWVNIPFATAAYCTAPTAIISNITDSKADINWNAMSGAVSYEYTVSTSMTPPSGGTATPGLNHNANNLLPATRYYIHLLSICVTDRSNWSTSGFTTASPTDVGNVGNSGNDIHVYPNPVKSILKVKIDHTLSAGDKVLLTDVTGKVIVAYQAAANMEIDMSNLAAGVYMLKYTGQTHNDHIKVVKD